MWIFSQKGFVSVVQHREKKDTLLIRSRIKEDLEPFNSEVFEDIGSDYQFRVFVSKEDLKKVLCTLVDQIDYSNFKDRIHELEHDRANAYMGIWRIMYNFATDRNWLGQNKKKFR